MADREATGDRSAAAGPAPPVESWRELARNASTAAGCPELARTVVVRWNTRMRSAAGRAVFARREVQLNPRLLPFGEREITVTLFHELAHLLAQFRSGKRRIEPHGPEWRRACHDLGIPGERACHRLPLPRARLARRHAYRCPACREVVRRVKPFRVAVACRACCRRHNGGRYDLRFRLVKESGGQPG